MSKLTYWERRQAQDQYQHFQKAEDVADQIAKLYLKASRYLSLQSDEIFERYQAKHGLSEAEALRLINTLQDRASLDELLQKLKSSESSKEKQELITQLEAPAYQARLERLRQTQNQLDLLMQNIYQQEKDFSTSFYTDLGNESYYRSIFNIQQHAGMAFSFNHVSADTIDQVVGSRWSGKNYSERIWGNTKSLAQDLKEELLINLVTGRTNREASEIIAHKFAGGASKARRLVWTESAYVSGELNFKAYQECGIEKYRYLATLDLRTSTICRALDGKVFLISERKVGINYPPMHPWCRSTTISDVDADLLKKWERSAIDPATGKDMKVPADMTYEQWYDKYVRGNAAAETEQKKIQNRSADKAQHQKYRGILGDEIPKSFVKFQEMKYSGTEEYAILKAQIKGMGYYNKAVAAEPDITVQVKEIAKKHGMKMEGLEYRIKGKDSFLRKVRSNYSTDGNEYEVKDILRYTYTASPEELSFHTLKAIESYKNIGYNTIEVKNYWLNKSNPYNGINTTIKSPDGQKFELQYHTPESYVVKDAMHVLYEKWRLLNKASPEAVALRKQMHEMSTKMKVPKDISEVK